jgi:DNA invertase Pin-like site-specific DNA recombinase
MLIGYARISTNDQTLNLQKDALSKAGCERIFTDTASGAKAERRGLDQALAQLRAGDTLAVWRLDRLGRSLPHLIETITSLENQGIGFKSLTENIDTTTSGGKLIFHIFGALAEFERNLIRERTMAGLEAARARGRKGGRPKLDPRNRKAQLARSLYQDKSRTVVDICKALNISRAQFYRYVNQTT